MDRELEKELDLLVDRVTTMMPNHLQDWLEIQAELDRIWDAGYTLQVEEGVTYFKSAGMVQEDIQELRRRLRRTFGS